MNKKYKTLANPYGTAMMGTAAPKAPFRPVEVGAITAIGLGLAWAADKAVTPMIAGAGLYLLGVYLGSQQRPEDGWLAE